MDRRECLTAIAAVLATPFCGFARQTESNRGAIGNFEYVYSDPALRKQFLDFLTNVFHLYPEHDFHAVLTRLSTPGKSDQEVYESLRHELGEIQPFLGALRYAIPALKKQKEIMADQTVMLVDPYAEYEGHLEIGSTGRYISTLQERLNITGDVFLLHTEEGGYGPEDIVERGQIRKIGTHIDMRNYSSEFSNIIGHNMLDMVTVYIGFHHCPIEKRVEFISSVRDVLRLGGTLILRDHDAYNEDLWRIAALAHDTFNAGIEESWNFNQNELRNFYSLQFIIDCIEALGFRHGGQLHLQRGDPTRNVLTAFRKV